MDAAMFRRFVPRLIAVVCLTLAFTANLALAERMLAAAPSLASGQALSRSLSITTPIGAPATLVSAVGSGGWAAAGGTIARAGSATDAEPAAAWNAAAPAIVVALDAADARVPIVILSLVLGCAGLVLLRLAHAGREATAHRAESSVDEPLALTPEEAIARDPLLAALGHSGPTDQATDVTGESPRWVQRLDEQMVSMPTRLGSPGADRSPNERHQRSA
jgi:hypothetical protein